MTKLLEFPAPAHSQRTVACPCGQPAPYRELRSKPVLTAVGQVQVSHPYYLCPHCHTGQFPVDVELDIERTEFSPGVLEVTTKSVERTAEAIGGDVAQQEQQQIQRAVQLDLANPIGQPVPILKVQGSYILYFTWGTSAS